MKEHYLRVEIEVLPQYRIHQGKAPRVSLYRRGNFQNWHVSRFDTQMDVYC